MAMETGKRIAMEGECDLITESVLKLISLKAKSRLAESPSAYDSLCTKGDFLFKS